MKNKFEETIEILKGLNEYKNNSIYTVDEIEEENDNIEDIDELSKRFKTSIESLKNVDKDDKDKVIKNLIDLHLIYSDFVWQYEEMHEMIKKMITNYREN